MTPRLFLEIGRAFYWLVPLYPGWRLITRAGNVYDVHADESGVVRCDCGDAVFRGRRCKHVTAVVALGLMEGK